MHAAVLFLCAGRGTRMRTATADKVLAPLGGRPVLLHSVAAFVESGLASTFVFTFRSVAQRRRIARVLQRLPIPATQTLRFVRGGGERQDSVARALAALSADIEWVFIHDAARPLVQASALRRAASLARRHGSAVFAHRVVDTIKELPEDEAPYGPVAARTLPRDRLWATETPQIFRRTEIAAAYAALPGRRRVTDDAQVMELAGRPVCLFENPAPNPKLTTPRDLAYVDFLLAAADARR